jgi:hypothetical protein
VTPSQQKRALSPLPPVAFIFSVYYISLSVNFVIVRIREGTTKSRPFVRGPFLKNRIFSGNIQGAPAAIN